MTSGEPTREPLGRLDVALILFAILAWAAARPYRGLEHDARLYALQALGRLHPESLGQDVFLRFGSQDAFTLFSPFYAALVGMLGVEDAARLLTLVGHLWWFSAAAVLSIRLLGRQQGLLATALVAGLPGYYGAWQVFRYAEPFLTPRLFGEAAVMTGMALLVSGRRAWAASLMVLGLAIHPLMGLAGVLLWMGVVLPRGAGWLLPVSVLAGTVVAVGLALLAPAYPVSLFEQGWLDLVRSRSPFLSMHDWNAESFQTVLVPLAALWVFGRACPREPGRTLFTAALIVGMLGLLVTLIGATLANVVLLTQGQAWRWTWIAVAMVPIAAVRAVPVLWRRGPDSRASLLLLATSVFLAGVPGIAAAGLALAVAACAGRLPTRIQRIVQLVAVACLAVSVYAWAGMVDVARPTTGPYSFSAATFDVVRACSRHVPLVVLTAALVYWTGRRKRVGHIPAFLSVVVLLTISPSLWAHWDRYEFRVPDPATADAWRRTIAPEAEVFWPDYPSASWFLLERRVYVSAEQTAGILFSPAAATEMQKRVGEVSMILPPTFAFRASFQGQIWPASERTLAETCRRSRADFVVSPVSATLPQAARPLDLVDSLDGTRYRATLYRCTDLAALGQIR